MSLRRIHPHGVQHTFNRSDQLPPATGTLRLYVDGTAGNDAASGQGGWANAWKTWGRIYRAACAILMVEPNNLTLILYLRGVFTDAIRGAFHLCGNSQVHVVHAIDDFTTIRAGTVSAVGGEAPVPKHGLERLTLLGAALDGTEVGMTLRLDDPIGGSRSTCTIVRVNVAGQYLWTTQKIGEFPAWVAASPANAIICTPSVYSTETTDLSFWDTEKNYFAGASPIACSSVIGLRGPDRIRVKGGNVVVAGCYARTTAGTWKDLHVVNTGWETTGTYQRALADYAILDTLAIEFGLMKLPTPATNMDLGNACNTARLTGGTSSYFTGYCNDRAYGAVTDSAIFERTSAGYFYHLGPYGQHSNIISRGGGGASYGACHCHHGSMRIQNISFLDLPAAGINALFRCEAMGAKIDVANANIEGANEGTGADLKVAHVKSGEIIFRSGFDATLYAKHRQLVVEEGGSIICRGAVVFGSNPGGGPDVYAGPRCLVEFQDNVTKSAVNSETAIQNGVDGQIVAAGTQFIAASAVFTAAHVGRSVKVSGAVNPANNAVHRITAYTNPTTVVIGASAGLVNEGPGLTWGLVGTPAPILEVARGGRVSQASGKTFNVRKPEVDPDTAVQEWGNYGYGVNGAIYEHENAEVTLGTVVEAAGAAGATGLAAKIKNGSKLVHTGGAVLLGVAPLDLGGNAGAIAWPATPSTDLASAAPQMCMVIPNA